MTFSQRGYKVGGVNGDSYDISLAVPVQSSPPDERREDEIINEGDGKMEDFELTARWSIKGVLARKCADERMSC